MAEAPYPAGFQLATPARDEFSRPPDYRAPDTPRVPGGILRKLMAMGLGRGTQRGRR